MFQNREPVVFFGYPPQVNPEQRKPLFEGQLFKLQEEYRLRYKTTSNSNMYQCVINALAFAGFCQTDSSGWNMIWSQPLKAEQIKEFDDYKKVNHFAGTWFLGRKDLMYRNIACMIREFGLKEFGIVPKTWILPADQRLF